LDELRQALASVKNKIARHRSKGINEQNTKSALIQPVLRALGWDVEDLDDVQMEYKRRPSDKPVDYALMLLRNPRLFVEAKALGQSLDDRKWAGQIIGYASVAGVEWVAITNGDEYRIYNAHAAVPVEEKLFRKVQVSDESTNAADTLSLLSKARIRENEIDVLWNAHFVDRQVRAAVEELFATDPEPNASLVRLVARNVKNLTAGDIKASLRRAQVQFDFPVDPAAVKFAPKPVSAEQRPPRKRKAGKKERQKAYIGISLSQIIEAGVITPPLTIFKKYRGQEFEATVQSDGAVAFNGAVYSSPSKAADEARRLVVGGTPHTNGWDFWQYRDKSGKNVRLDAARQEYLARRK